MAADVLVLCNPLCFLLNRYGKTGVKVLKSAALDFYNADELIPAKRRLIQDVDNLELDSSVKVPVPYIPERRGDTNQAVRVVDDIFTLLTFLDKNLLLKNLPKYVADNPDNMPSTRLYEGDLMVIMNALEKLTAQLTGQGATLSAIMKEVHDLQAQVRTSSAVNEQVWPSLPASVQSSSGSGLQSWLAKPTGRPSLVIAGSS